MDKQAQERKRTMLYMNFALGKREDKTQSEVSNSTRYPSSKSISFSSQHMPKLFRRHKGSTSKSSIHQESGLKLYDTATERKVQQNYHPKITLKSLHNTHRNTRVTSPQPSTEKNSPRLSLEKIEVDTERSWQKYC